MFSGPIDPAAKRGFVGSLSVQRSAAARALGVRQTFADVGQTLAEFLGVAPLLSGQSFLAEIWHD